MTVEAMKVKLAELETTFNAIENPTREQWDTHERKGPKFP